MKKHIKGQGTGHIVDSHHNQDKTLKESFALFKGGTLDFLDVELTGEVTDILSTEMTETVTRKSFSDKALKMSTNTGLHSEWEAEISEEDMMRFGAYNLQMSLMHKIPFTTVIITTKKPSISNYKNPSVSFTPKIINLKERDADEALAEIDRKIKAGEQGSINELLLIYLPLYGSKSGKSTADLLDIAIKLTPKVAGEDKNKRHKLQDLLILLTSTFISEEERIKVWEANMRILEDNPAIIWLEDRGKSQQKIEIARNMLRRGRNTVQEISEDTGLDVERILDLQKELQL